MLPSLIRRSPNFKAFHDLTLAFLFGLIVLLCFFSSQAPESAVLSQIFQLHASVSLHMLLFALFRNTSPLANTYLSRFSSNYTSFLKAFLILSLFNRSNYSPSSVPSLSMYKLQGTCFVSPPYKAIISLTARTMFRYLYILI